MHMMPTAATSLEEANPKIKRVVDPYSGKELIAVPALNPDVAIVHVQRANQRDLLAAPRGAPQVALGKGHRMGALKQRLPVRLSQRFNQVAPGATAKGRPDKAQKPGNHRVGYPTRSRRFRHLVFILVMANVCL